MAVHCKKIPIQKDAGHYRPASLWIGIQKDAGKSFMFLKTWSLEELNNLPFCKAYHIFSLE